jgi:eukaryotic-like serine/threonine-protein kinase
MVELSAEQFAQRAFDVNLLDERQLQDIWGQLGSREVSGEEFRQYVVRRGLLTKLQMERLLRGERTGYFYGQYKVLYQVGKGTFARVYRAVHKTTGEVVAVKVLRKSLSQQKEIADRFYREGIMGATLRHPNIVPIFDVHSDGDTHYLVMEFTEGRNLREFIKIRKKFDPVDSTKLIMDVAAGLSYAFDRGICHRDLKLSNILVSSRGVAKLVDFGLAAAEDATGDAENPRTIDYAGLERSTGVRKDDPRSDIYFLGCIYYHILTGQSPIVETTDRTQRLSKTRFQSVVPIIQADPGVPAVVAHVVNKAMELNPDSRYQSPADMLVDLKMAAARITDQPIKLEADKVVAQRTVMVVESHTELQNVLRERLKNSGYRVLVLRDPDRALQRFSEDAKAADCVIFSTSVLGQTALEAFNRFASDKGTQNIPAILLLAEHHAKWQAKAALDDTHALVTMPIKIRQLRELISKLLPADESLANSSTG